MRQHLIVDADDTLWENNIYFERAFNEFIDFLGHSSLQPREVRAILDEIEIANAKIHGYGSKNFGRNLRECYRRLCEREHGHESSRGERRADVVAGEVARVRSGEPREMR